jgi:hypothetical protein
MASYRYATKDLSINNAQAFMASINAEDTATTKNSTILYAVLGHANEWPDEPNPIEPPDNDQYLYYGVWRDAIGAKKITPQDVSHVAPRYDWISGTSYAMYRDTDIDMYEREFYVLTDEYNVYKCLYNNGGAASTVKPTGYSTSKFTTSDGYTWKYMFTISLGLANKFLTSNYIPVRTLTSSDSSTESDRQLAVQNAAVNGSIEIVEVNDAGSGYVQLTDGRVEAGGKLTLQLSNSGEVPSLLDDIYTGSSVYVKSGTGSSQLRRIIGYNGSTKVLTVNTAFDVTPNNDSRVIISPTVTIVGDGAGALAYARVNIDTNAIANVSVIQAGSGYTRAKVIITANTDYGAGATANAIISSVGGHGSNPIRELYADKIMLNAQFRGSLGISANGNGYIPANTEFRSISILKDPILKVDANNNIAAESVANTSNSPSSLRLTTRLGISYLSSSGVDNIEVGDILTNERLRLRAEVGQLEFVTELNAQTRETASLENALQAANGHVVYIREDETQTDPSFYVAYLNNVQGYANYIPFTKDDVILKSDSTTKIATVETIAGPEANTYSGQVLYTENNEKVTRNLDQIEDIKIVLDF